MLGYLSVNGSLTFKKSYYDKDYYNIDWMAQHTKKKKGYAKLKSKKGKGSRIYKITKQARRKIECATLLMRHNQDKNKYAIKFLTLTVKNKLLNPNKAIKEFFNHLRIIGIVKSYWWVKEYHPEHYKNYGIKKEHFHCLVCIKKFVTKKKLLEVWQQKTDAQTFIIKLENIRVRNKYNSFSYQIVMYVTKYCTKSIDSFSTPVYNMSKSLRSKNLPLIYSEIIDFLLENISKNQNESVNDIIYYREHCNQAYLTRNKVETYMKLKEYLEKDHLYRWLYEQDYEYKDK